MIDDTNIHRFPVRPRTVRQPSPVEQIVGIASDLLPLAKGAAEQDVLSIIRRLDAVAELLTNRGGAA